MAKRGEPATAAAVSDDVDISDDVRAAASKRNRRLATILVTVAGVLLVAFVASVAGIARTHAVDRDLYQRWHIVAGERDCCFLAHPDCEEGAAVLLELRERLRAREHESHVVADLFARMLGLADIELTSGPGLPQVEAEFAQCPRLQGAR
jgi:hypothetical protein